MITIDNFFIATYALFKICKTPKRKADYTSYSKWGDVSSQYWYGEDKNGRFVIRKSDHWVFRKHNDNSNKSQNCRMIASCNWQILIPKTSNYDNDKCTISGKCYLSKFTKLA